MGASRRPRGERGGREGAGGHEGSTWRFLQCTVGRGQGQGQVKDTPGSCNHGNMSIMGSDV